MQVSLEPDQVQFIVVHCSATPPEMDIGVETIRKWHKERNWSDVGYHGIIKRDGTYEQGRPFHKTGAHAYGYNSKSVGICLIGGVDKNNRPEQNFTPEQYETLSYTLQRLRLVFPNANICGHRDLNSTHYRSKACPSFDVREWVLGYV